jgi:hypothetical protein
VFPPVEEIYDRYDPAFRDSEPWRESRRRANEYVAGLGDGDLRVHPFLFIWNDFAVDQLTLGHEGIKWHRHPEEPEYDYADPKCARALRVIRERSLPVVLEEELGNTVRFIRDIAPDLRVIIPHLGALNGGYESLVRQGIWELPRVYADTSLAERREIRDYVQRFGGDRLLFGSDFPFADPRRELRKIRECQLPAEIEQGVLGWNMDRLLRSARPLSARAGLGVPARDRQREDGHGVSGSREER